MGDEDDADLLILEGIVTTTDSEGRVNVSPMGPQVDREVSQLHFRPFRSSRTYRNLKQNGQGVFHVTDNVAMFAQAAVGKIETEFPFRPANTIAGSILLDTCRWFEFCVRSIDDEQERTDIHVEIVDRGEDRPFFGFNRGKHAVIEAAILASRVHFLPAEEIKEAFCELEVWVAKTGGHQERESFEYLTRYVADAHQKSNERPNDADASSR